MGYFDVFNGDADGICALHQLRLSEPRSATLVTGVKRDIGLLARVGAQADDQVCVLDISLDSNSAALNALLARGVRVQYFDHHAATAQPKHANLEAHIDTAPDICTSALVDAYLGGAHRAWAVTAAFGDGMPQLAQRLAQSLGLSAARLAELQELGELINYNAYGEEVSDLHYAPVALYQRIKPYAQPLQFIAREAEVVQRLRLGRADDMRHASELQPQFSAAAGDVYLLPDAPWSRRLRGDLSHQLAQRLPNKALALLGPNSAGGYTVSVRAPKARPSGADTLCKQFATGGGRAAAAGINQLPAEQVEGFVQAFFTQFG